MPPPDFHTVVVTFSTTPGTHATAREQIASYVENFLSRQPGFIESWLHDSVDGEGLLHYARWRSESDFKKAGEKARVHPDMPTLLQYQPSGRGYRVYRAFTAPLANP